MVSRKGQQALLKETSSEEFSLDVPDDIRLVNDVRQVFAANNWPIDERDSFEGGGPFERTVSMLTKLKGDEVKLILDLLGRFVRFEFDQYLSEMRKIIDDLVRQIAPESVAIVPIKSSKDLQDGKSKSGDMMGIIARAAFSGGPVRAEAYNNIKSGRISTLVGRRGFYIIGVDDFIGTGDTAKSFIDDYVATFPDHLCRLKLVSLVALEQGARSIRSRGCDLFCLHELSKGISDFEGYSRSDKLRHASTMAGIEARIRIRNEYHMGYGRSEGLVKMMRTPNNTFPVFWSTGLRNGAPWPATFPR